MLSCQKTVNVDAETFIIRRYIVQLLFMSNAGPDIGNKCKERERERFATSGENHPRFLSSRTYAILKRSD